MKIALVHDWLNGMRGGEKILEVLVEIFPDADIFTLLYERDKISPVINKLNIKTSFVQNLPGAKRFYRYYLPLFPKAIESFDLQNYDLVISTSHCAAKGVITPKDKLHICYCLTPMRYVWDFDKVYFGFKSYLYRPMLKYLKYWDLKTSSRAKYYFAISLNVANRIKRYYNKESQVLYPPVDTSFFVPQDFDSDYYLIVSALVPYKKIDIAVDAFNKLGLPLLIVGTGTEYVKLKRRAGANIKFLGWQTDNEVKDYYAGCKALIFTGIEDFGITILEAQSCGRPVIAYRGGGALETIDTNIPTGIFFDGQNGDSLIEAVNEFEKERVVFDKEKIRRNVLRFDRALFKKRLQDEIQRIYNLYYSSQSSE